jgi:RNA ligase (TIGR02306 family)
MSTHSCPIVEVALSKHPDADSLSIATIKGWQCVVKTCDFENERFGVYVPIDSVAEKDHPLLGFLEGKKVKTIRLRKAISQGVLLPLGQVLNSYPELRELCGPVGGFEPEAFLGQDVSDVLKIKKWEEPVKPMTLTGAKTEEESRPPWLEKYTDIENWNNWTRVIEPGEQVVITEKLHGTNAVFALVDGKYYFCSRNRCLRHEPRAIKIPRFSNKWLKPFFWKTKIIQPDTQNVWYKISVKYELESKLRWLAKEYNEDRVAIFGEIVGVQDLMYGLKKGELEFYMFDFQVGSKQGYNDHGETEMAASLLGLKMVPILKKGTFELSDLELRDGQTTINNSNVREGIVIRPQPERFHNKLGRVILKRVSEKYLLRSKQTDY